MLHDLVIIATYLGLAASYFLLGQVIESILRSNREPTANGDLLPPSEIARKFAHITCGLTLAALPWTGASFVAGVAVGLVVLASLLILRPISNHSGFLAFLYMRRGSFLFAFGLIYMSLFYFDRPQLFAVAFAVLALADPAAGLLGSRWGETPLLGKTRLGTIAFAIVSFAVLCPGLMWMGVSTSLAISAALVMALALAGIELVSGRGLDNLTIPAAAAAGLSFVLQILA